MRRFSPDKCQFLQLTLTVDIIHICFRSVMDGARITQELQIVTKERDTKGRRVRIWYHSL